MLTRKPRKGDKVRWPEWPTGQYALVLRTPTDDHERNLCWCSYPDGSRAPFIWRSRDGLNPLAAIVEP